MFSILLMFSSEINISVTADSRGSGLFGLDLSDTMCNLSERGFERTDALLDERPAITSAERKRKRKKYTDSNMRQHCKYMIPVFLHLFDVKINENITIIRANHFVYLEKLLSV